MIDFPFAVFLFTDIAGSTGMWDTDAGAMDRAMIIHDEVLRNSIAAHDGTVFKHTGDGICAVFEDAAGAFRAAVQGQRHMVAVPWPGCGEFREHSGDCFGLDVSLARRVLELTPGGSVLITEPMVALLDEEILNHTWLFDVGMYRLRGITRPIRVYRVAAFPIGVDSDSVMVA
jgi:class 3 adenylate cyclase